MNKKITRTSTARKSRRWTILNVGFVVEEIGKLEGQDGVARVVIEGHSDGSMKGQMPKSLVQELSLKSRQSVKEALVRKFPLALAPAGLDADRVGPAGRSVRTENGAKNRRVEIKVYPAEATVGTVDRQVRPRRGSALLGRLKKEFTGALLTTLEGVSGTGRRTRPAARELAQANCPAPTPIGNRSTPNWNAAVTSSRRRSRNT